MDAIAITGGKVEDGDMDVIVARSTTDYKILGSSRNIPMSEETK